MKPLVLVSPDKTNVPLDVTNSLFELAEIEYVKRPYDDRLQDAYAVLVGTEPINSDYLDLAPKLKLVARFGVGYDSVNVKECTLRGIVVTHTPNVLSGAVADHTWALILGFNRHIAYADRYSRNNWARREGRVPFGWDADGKTLGILGLGRIGVEVLKRAQGFPMNVIYHDIARNKKIEQEHNIEYVTFDQLLERSDILTIHTSLSDSTLGMINEYAFEKMKPNALIVNTSRGPVIDEKALIRALLDERIKGAALDVFENEPMNPENPLLKMDNVLLTPHIASATWETRKKMAECAVENIKDFLEGGRPPNIVPEQQGLKF